MPFSFVTVAHADDEWLLRLQARSMRLYLTPALIGEIVVVENFEPGRGVAWRNRLRAEYGHLSDRVRFIGADMLGPLPAVAGWWTQQALKLLVSREVSFQRYVVLDAKNHLVRPLHQGFLEATDGRMLSRRYGYRSHPLRHYLEETLRFCDVPVEPHLDWFMPASTPFAIDRSDALEAIGFTEARTGKPLAQSLVERRITEFFLLAGRLTRRGLTEQRYDFSQIACPVVWDSMAEPAALLPAIREAEERGAPVFAVHRRVIPKMGKVSREILGQFWKRHGLFGSTRDAVAELAAIGAQSAAGA